MTSPGIVPERWQSRPVIRRNSMEQREQRQQQGILRTALRGVSRRGGLAACMLALLGLFACDRPGDQPLPPESPPRPEVMTESVLRADIRNAVYSYTGPQPPMFDGRPPAAADKPALTV
jgi:hypothetical protein